MTSQTKLKQLTLTSEDFVEIFGNKFKQDWDGKTTIVPHSEALRERGGPMMAASLSFAPNNPGGDSLMIAFMSIMRLESALNDQIDVVNSNFNTIKEIQQSSSQIMMIQQQGDVYGQYSTSIEVLAYIMKTTIDKIICAVSVAKYGYDENGGIRHDCIGSLLDRGASEDVVSSKTQVFADGFLAAHYKFLFRINDIHNAYKHTFSTTQISVVDNITPTMATIYKPRNSTQVASRLAFIICYDAVQEFESLLTAAKNYLTTTRRK